MWGIEQALEALRSFATLPWETWWRRAWKRGAEPALPLARRLAEESGPPPAGGRTDLPLLGPWDWRVPGSWSLDPVSGHDFGGGPSRAVRARPDVPGADLLRCWVQGRGGDLLHAARCAAAGDEAAAAHVDAWLGSFLQHCPPGRGPQWSTAMEVALRAVRLVQAASLSAGPGAPATRRELFDRALRRHESWLRRHSDWRAHRTGNHFLVATAGRFLLAACLDETARRRREARRAWRLFWREFRRQVLPDGLHFESSTHYHLLCLDAALHVLDAGRRAELVEPRRARERLIEAVKATALLARPDGSLAAVGDGDDGAFLAPEAGALEDVRPLLARAGRLLGTEAAPSMRPGLLPHGGLVVLALDGERPVHVTVSATPRGRAGTGGHGHDDCGSYELWAGEPVVVDRGTGSYTGDPELRERLRSAASHSVVVADGRTQNPPVPGRPFRRSDRAHPVLVEFDESAGGEVAIGHHGWCDGPGALAVLRRLRLEAGGLLRVRDELRGQGEHALVLRVQWAPGLRPGEATRDGRSHLVKVTRDARSVASLRVEEPLEKPVSVEVEHAPRQGRIESARATEAGFEGAPPVVFEHSVGVPDPAGSA